MNKRLEKLTHCPGVYRVLVLDEQTKQWKDPKGGQTFRAFRYECQPDGKLKKVGKYFSSFALAKIFRLKSERRRPEFVPPIVDKTQTGKAMLFGELAKVWCDVWLPNKNVSTQIRYRSYLKHFQYFWNIPVEKIEPNDVDMWISQVKQPDYLAKGHSTRCDYNHEFSVLRVMLNFYASRYNRNYRLPFLKDHKAMLKVREKMKISKDLTVDEFKRFMVSLKEVCREFDSEVVYYLASMQYATYCRVQEAAALHYEDFDFARNKLSVNKKIQWLRAKGFENKLVDGSKANGGKELPMPELAKRIFQEWVLRSGVRNGPLFTMDGELLTYRQIEYRYSQALKRAGLPFSATHLLRHASLTEFYDTCKDLLLTAKMAGQKDIRSTMKYTKVRDERVIQVQHEMDKKLSSIEL